jgi:hypothetical protein
LEGQLFGPQALIDALWTHPMRRRHVLAQELALRSRGAYQVPTRAFVEHQLRVMREARATPTAVSGRSLGEGLRG